MPVKYHIDHERRTVFAKCDGKLTPGELFRYQRDIWSMPELAGYDEFVEIIATDMVVPSSVGLDLRGLAELAASSDAREDAKLALVAQDDLAFGLARMYKLYRKLEARGTRQVEVFRSRQEAMDWLGVRGDVPV